MKTLLCLTGLALLFFSCAKAPTDQLVRKEAVKRGDLRDVIEQTGEVQPVVKVDLKSESSGRIDTLFVLEGARLRKGQRILKIDPTQMQTQKERLDLSLETATLKEAQARRDYENALTLQAGGSIPQQKVDDLKRTLDLAGIEVKAIELDLHDIEYKLSKTLIVSPMDGVLISLLVEVGEIAVSATSGFSGGTAIGTVADISKLEVVTQIGEVDYRKIRMDQPVTIRLESDANARSSGRVYFISLAAKKETGAAVSNFEVRVKIDSVVPGLVPGVNVNVDFVALEKKNVLCVPYTMVQKGGKPGKEAWFVWRPAGAAIPEGFRAGPPEGRGGKEAADNRRRGPGMGGRGKTDKRVEKAAAAKRKAVQALGLVRQRIEVGETDFSNYEVRAGLVEGDTVIRILGEEKDR